jgi:DNA-binding response OmpR family regulator
MRTPQQNGSKKPPCILIVDDDAALIRTEASHLASLGYAVEVAATMEEAESLFKGAAFDLAIVDLMMETRDAGIVLAHHFKKHAPEVPIIMTSDLSSETGMVFDLAGLGERRWIKVDRILAKPVRPEQLAFAVETLLGPKSLSTTATPAFHHNDDHHRLEI